MKKRLNKILKQRGITQVMLAERLNITPQSLNSRLKNPTLNSLKEIASILNCELCDLVDESKKIQLIIGNELYTFYSLKELKEFLFESLASEK